MKAKGLLGFWKLSFPTHQMQKTEGWTEYRMFAIF